MTKKTIEIKLTALSDTSNFELCEFIEGILLKSPLNSTIFNLDILETKVTKEEPYVDKTNVSS